MDILGTINTQPPFYFRSIYMGWGNGRDNVPPGTGVGDLIAARYASHRHVIEYDGRRGVIYSPFTTKVWVRWEDGTTSPIPTTAMVTFLGVSDKWGTPEPGDAVRLPDGSLAVVMTGGVNSTWFVKPGVPGRHKLKARDLTVIEASLVEA